MRVAFQILADGEDVTALFKDRLKSLVIVDEAGMKSDTAEIVIDDRDYRVELPETGARLEISIGFKETGLTFMGAYTVDELSGDYPIKTMTIKAKAADMLQGIRSPKTRAWEGKTLGDIAAKIAGEHGLRLAISDSLKPAFFGYLAQTAESDLNLLTRMARDLDATAKPAGDALIIVKRGEGKSTDGQDLPTPTIAASEITNLTWTATGRGRYGKVTAEWSELGSAAVHQVSAGDGKPALKLRHRHATQAEAQRAAESALTRSKRASGKLSASLAGFYPSLSAEAYAELPDIKPELTGQWLVNRVEHRLDAVLVTSFDGERDNEEKST